MFHARFDFITKGLVVALKYWCRSFWRSIYLFVFPKVSSSLLCLHLLISGLKKINLKIFTLPLRDLRWKYFLSILLNFGRIFYLRKVSSALRSFFCLNKNGNLGFEIKSEDLFSDFRTNFARLFLFVFYRQELFYVLFIIRFIDLWEKFRIFIDFDLKQTECWWVAVSVGGVWSARVAVEMHLNGSKGWNLMRCSFEV